MILRVSLPEVGPTVMSVTGDAALRPPRRGEKLSAPATSSAVPPFSLVSCRRTSIVARWGLGLSRGFGAAAPSPE